MFKKRAALSVLVCALAAIPVMIAAQDSRTILTNVAKSMGADNLRTIQFSGMGSNAGIGQNTNPKAAWPTARVKTYRREIDFNATASHVEMVRVQGGGDQTQNQYIAPDAPWSTQFGFWLTPFGFVKGAIANNAAIRSETIDGAKYNIATFMLQNKYKVVGYINDQNLVERVQTWIDNDVLGDMLAEGWYSNYKDFGGVKFPTMIVEKQAGFPVLILSVSDVKPNIAVNIQRQPSPTAEVQTVSVQTEKVADGVFYLKGGTHHSVAVEFNDHVVVIEAPLNEQRSLAVIAEVKKLIPNKPIKYLVNTHHHFDHSGGLRTYVDEGATIVTHEVNKEFYEKAFSAPRTLNPDKLAQSRKKAVIETVGDKKVLSDGTRALELHQIKGSPHNDGILMAVLPKEKILIEVDVYTPPNPPPASAAPATTPAVNPSALNLVDGLEKLKIDFERILPLHGPGAVTRADLYAAVRKPAPDMATLLAAKPVVAAPPASPGKQMLDTVCTTCHNLNRVQAKNLALSDWQTIVERMKGKGAELSDDDTATLLDFLVKTYGPK